MNEIERLREEEARRSKYLEVHLFTNIGAAIALLACDIALMVFTIIQFTQGNRALSVVTFLAALLLGHLAVRRADVAKRYSHERLEIAKTQYDDPIVWPRTKDSPESNP